MTLFDKQTDELEVEEDIREELYNGNKRSNVINYDHCIGCPLRGNIKVWDWRGNHDSKLCFIGMNPGTKEKLYKKPFVGPSGRKFEERVIDGLELETEKERIGKNDISVRGDFYITNVVKCFTANNANPPSKAIEHCWNHLKPELEGRRIIVPLGNLAQKAVKEYYKGPAIIHPMTHPAAACRKGIYDARLISETKELKELL